MHSDSEIRAEPAAAVPAPRRAAVAFVFVTVLLDMLALGIIIPVLPKLVVDFVGGDAAEGARIYGLFGTAWALMQFFFSPVQGALSDRFGRRPVILLSNVGVGLDYLGAAPIRSVHYGTAAEKRAVAVNVSQTQSQRQA